MATVTIEEIERATSWIRENNAKPVDSTLLKKLRISRARISQLTSSEIIPSRRVERTVYIPQAAIEELRRQLKQPRTGRPRTGESEKNQR